MNGIVKVMEVDKRFGKRKLSLVIEIPDATLEDEQ